VKQFIEAITEAGSVSQNWPLTGIFVVQAKMNLWEFSAINEGLIELLTCQKLNHTRLDEEILTYGMGYVFTRNCNRLA
jgi:hypothetical protein